MKKRTVLILAIAVFYLYPAIDYQGLQINQSGVTISSRTSPAALASVTQSINMAGLLDQTFGIQGVVQKNISGNTDALFALAIQPDGKIIAVGQTNINGNGQTGVFLTMRFNQNGTLDPSFGNGAGYVTKSFSGPSFIDGAYGVALQPDGKIVVVGQTNIYNTGNQTGYFGIIRYNSDGSPDISFGPNGNGSVTKNFGGVGSIDGATCVLLQPDGKIVVGGGTNFDNTAPGTGSVALIRYNSNGTVDTTFGTNGTILINVSGVGQVDAAYKLLLQPDGKIIVIGGTNVNETNTLKGAFLIMRYTSNGILDTTFNGNGIVTTALSNFTAIDTAYGGALQPDGKIIAVGGQNKDTTIAAGNIGVVRYNSNGSPDISFGREGTGIIIVPNISGHTNLAGGATLQPDGKLLVVGETYFYNGGATGNGGSIILIRYNTDGTYDTTFGPNNSGILTTKISPIGQLDYGNAIALQNNGKIVVVGQSNTLAITGGNCVVCQYINPFSLPIFTASYGAAGLL